MIKFKVETAKLKEVIRSVKKGISKDKSVAEIHRGINFVAEDGIINVITCDGYKAFSNILAVIDGDKDFKFTIPLFRIPTESNVETEIIVDEEQGKVELDFGNEKTIINLLAAEYSLIEAIKKMFGCESNNYTIVNAKKLKETLDSYKNENVIIYIGNPIVVKQLNNVENKRIVLPVEQRKD